MTSISSATKQLTSPFTIGDEQKRNMNRAVTRQKPWPITAFNNAIIMQRNREIAERENHAERTEDKSRVNNNDGAAHFCSQTKTIKQRERKNGAEHASGLSKNSSGLHATQRGAARSGRGIQTRNPAHMHTRHRTRANTM